MEDSSPGESGTAPARAIAGSNSPIWRVQAPAASNLTLSEINSIKLGKVMGIPVRLHWTFLVMLYMLVSLGSSEGNTAGTISVLGITFGSVFLHELGHSLMARRLGIRVLDITFWPLGGMARMSHMPEDARVEGLVAMAGPLVNFILAAIGLACLPLWSDSSTAMGSLMINLLVINLLIGTFNLIPAFPMDGGRILRAALARNNDWVSATEGAVKVGRFFAGLMFFGSLLYSFSTGDMGLLCVMPLIAGFIWITGAKELLAVRLRHGQNPFGKNVSFGQSPFGSAGMGFEPDAGADAQWPGEQAAAAGDQTLERPQQGSGTGFSDEEIKDLENFHGRLRNRDED